MFVSFFACVHYCVFCFSSHLSHFAFELHFNAIVIYRIRLNVIFYKCCVYRCYATATVAVAVAAVIASQLIKLTCFATKSNDTTNVFVLPHKHRIELIMFYLCAYYIHVYAYELSFHTDFNLMLKLEYTRFITDR